MFWSNKINSKKGNENMIDVQNIENYEKGYVDGKKSEWMKCEYEFWCLWLLDDDEIMNQFKLALELTEETEEELQKSDFNESDEYGHDASYEYGYQEGVKKTRLELSLLLMNVSEDLEYISECTKFPEDELKVVRREKRRIEREEREARYDAINDAIYIKQLKRENNKRKRNSLFSVLGYILGYTLFFIVFIFLFFTAGMGIAFAVKYMWLIVIIAIIDFFMLQLFEYFDWFSALFSLWRGNETEMRAMFILFLSVMVGTVLFKVFSIL